MYPSPYRLDRITELQYQRLLGLVDREHGTETDDAEGDDDDAKYGENSFIRFTDLPWRVSEVPAAANKAQRPARRYRYQ